MTTLEKVLEEVKRLAPDERQRLREMLDTLPDADEAEMRRREAEFERRLLEKGLTVKLPLPASSAMPFEEYEPIKVQGKPVSETIIEERR